MSALCVREATLALMAAAGRALDARYRRDQAALEFWRGLADQARTLLRDALESRAHPRREAVSPTERAEESSV